MINYKSGCFQWFKDTKMKANHNVQLLVVSLALAVSNGSKILKWKQITTYSRPSRHCWCCFQWFKDTKMKANHNVTLPYRSATVAVSNGSKILKWKQITTYLSIFNSSKRCFQWFKDTKMKANHNLAKQVQPCARAVSNGSKILKWKQITTLIITYSSISTLFPMVQRY